MALGLKHALVETHPNTHLFEAAQVGASLKISGKFRPVVIGYCIPQPNLDQSLNEMPS